MQFIVLQFSRLLDKVLYPLKRHTLNFIDILQQPLNITFSYANQKYITKVKKNIGSKTYSSGITGEYLHPP